MDVFFRATLLFSFYIYSNEQSLLYHKSSAA